MIMKNCRKCEKQKELEFFSKWKQGSDGLSLYCKECVSKSGKEYREKDIDSIRRRKKENRNKNPEKYKEHSRSTYQRYCEKYKEKQRRYNENNREKINEKRRQYYLKNREEINFKERIFLSTCTGKKESREYYHKTKEKFDIKIKARNKLRYAVKVKKILKPEKCEMCFEKRKLHGHHEDYSKPIEVIWVCNFCHAQIHMKRGN